MRRLSVKEVIMHFKRRYSLFYLYGWLMIIGFVFVLLFAAFFEYIRAFFFIVAFVIIGGYSMIYQRVIRWSLGVELIFTGTVLCSIAYGPLAGATVGFVGLLLGEILSMKICPQTMISFLAIIIVGVLSHYIYSGSVFTTGIIMLLFYNAMIVPLYYMIGSNPVKLFAFSSTHIIFHFWMFKHIAPLILLIMK